MANIPNVYEQNRELILSYFHPNTLPSKLNIILGGPREILDQMFYMPTQQDPMEEEQYVNEGSHLPIMLDTNEEEQLQFFSTLIYHLNRA